jgi:hypothetical protein
MFTCNSFILVHGDYTEDKKFKVNVMGMPPPEPRLKSLQVYILFAKKKTIFF